MKIFEFSWIICVSLVSCEAVNPLLIAQGHYNIDCSAQLFSFNTVPSLGKLSKNNRPICYSSSGVSLKNVSTGDIYIYIYIYI